MFTKTHLIAAVMAGALSLAAGHASAQAMKDSMPAKDSAGTMKSDGMKADSMKSDSMMKDSMKKDDMKPDAMKSDSMMKDSMKK